VRRSRSLGRATAPHTKIARLIALALRLGLAAVLGVAAASKLARPRESAASLAALRVPRAALGVAVGLELVLAVGVALGSALAAYAAAGLLVAFAAVLVAAIRRGALGRPCPCFGARGRIGWPAVGRNLGLAAGFAAVPWLPRLDAQGWLAVGLALALAGVAVLVLAVLALAREVGELRLRLPPDAALELASEGPEMGERTPLVERFRRDSGARFALAVFSSEGCRLCRALEPAVAALGRDPLLSVQVFDEVRDRDAWEELAVPGSPYAVALALDGTVRAKGTFNSLGQLETILAAAERREARA
jgi:hypothetical protein